MNNDNNLKDLLNKWGVEQTDEKFTDKIMNRIHNLAGEKRNYEMFNSEIKHVYVILVLLILSSVIVTCTFLKPVRLSLEIQFALSKISPQHLYDVLILIPAFWLLMFFNILFVLH